MVSPVGLKAIRSFDAFGLKSELFRHTHPVNSRQASRHSSEVWLISIGSPNAAFQKSNFNNAKCWSSILGLPAWVDISLPLIKRRRKPSSSIIVKVSLRG